MKKEFTLRLDDAACAELENLKKLSGEKTDAKAIRFAIQNYAQLNDRYIETQRQIYDWSREKYSNNYCDSLNLVLKLFPEIDREKLEKELDK